MSYYDEEHNNNINKRRKYFLDLLGRYKTQEDYILFSKLLETIARYFMIAPDETKFRKDYAFNNEKTAITEYKFRNTSNFDNNVEVFCWYTDNDDFTSLDTVHGLVSFGHRTGIGFQEFVLQASKMERLVEYEDEYIPFIRTEEDFFQNSLVYKDHEMFSLVVNTYLIDAGIPPFFLDADMLPEIFEAIGDSVNEFIPGNEHIFE